MTKAEYDALYIAARKLFPRLTAYGMKKIYKVYVQASNSLAEKILAAQKKGLSELTTSSWTSIQMQIELNASLIMNSIDANIHKVVSVGAKKYSLIHERYLSDVLKESGGKITRAGIENMFVALNNQVVASVVNRIFRDGYVFSDRIWRAGAAAGESMKNVISAGLSQNRDLIKIAKDVQVYVKKNRAALAKRYGDLKAGTKGWLKRIRGDVDYNALRLVRSELYASLQDAARWSGQFNPGCSGLYDWIRGGSQDWGCDCPGNARNSPYTLEKLPGYSHPNCLCRIQPRLRDRKQFVNDLREWGAGNQVPYLDDWYQDYYLVYA